MVLPHLHFHFYLFIDKIWDLLAQGAAEFNNINVVMGNCPIEDLNLNLNLSHHHKAIQILKALADQVTPAQSQGTPILVQSAIVSKFGGSTLRDNPTTNSFKPTFRDTKRNPTTPKSGESKDRNKQAKKLHQETGG